MVKGCGMRKGEGEEWYGKGVWHEEGRGEIGTRFIHLS